MRFVLNAGLLALSLIGALQAQPNFYSRFPFSHADTIRGALRPERTCFDVTYYGLNISVDLINESIEGYVDIDYRVEEPTNRIQLDLYRNMKIDRIVLAGKTLNFQREEDAFFVDLPYEQSVNSLHKLRVYYSGVPQKAKNPPWDGGFVWKLDQKDRTWVGVACEGDGASLWWPNKDYLGDEPDSMLISVEVPKRFFVASNGNLRSTQQSEDGKRRRYNWFVSNAINNYNASISIGYYTHFSDTYVSADGDELDLDYYVLDYNEERAKEHFKQVKPMLEAYEHYLGKYPFWEDGFALIETPYLGMEHQSGIAYGNRFMRGYLGGMIPKDQDWDYRIIHETGHEYFGNSISVADHAEMWIHESFTTYLEALYVEFHHGEKSARKYLRSQRPYITNKVPILGPLNVNFQGWKTSDHYYKGAWMLHTLRHAINDDQIWFGLLRGLYERFQNSIVNTQMIIDFVNDYTKSDYTAFFNQYLLFADLPTLQFREVKTGAEWEIQYRWKAGEKNFNLPVEVKLGGEILRIQPVNEEWQILSTGSLRLMDVKVRSDKFLMETQMR